MASHLQQLAKIIREKSYLEGDFVLTSGKRSSYYFDCRQTALSSKGSFLMAKCFYRKLEPIITGIGGIELGAVPIISAITVFSFLEANPLHGFVIRKNAKEHGAKKVIEGLNNFPKPGANVAIIDDTVTTGGSLLLAVEKAVEAKFVVSQVLCVLDREEGGKELLEEHGFKLDPLFTVKDFQKI